jgi:hypothetical protein
VLRNRPLAARLLRRLAYQLVPAALVTGVGVLMLSSLTRVADAPPVAAPTETAINGDAVFKILPREPVEAAADAAPDVKQEAKRAAAARASVNPKSAAASPAAAPSRKLANEAASSRQAAAVTAPPPTGQVPAPSETAAVTPESDNSVIGKLRSATTAVQRIPQWATRSVANWFAADAPPPRPPAPVPAQNFQAAM